MLRMNFQGRKDQRRMEAFERQALYDSLSLEERLKQAQESPGESKREIAKLKVLIKKASEPAPEPKKKAPAKTDKKAQKAKAKKADA